jgi:hypothetical protein
MPTPLFIGGNDFIFYNTNYKSKKNKIIKGFNNSASLEVNKYNIITINAQILIIILNYIILIVLIILIYHLILLSTDDYLFFDDF